VARLLRMMREKGVAGAWRTGTTAGPGRDAYHSRRVDVVWGPDGFAIAVARPNGRHTTALLRESGVRRPVLLQVVSNGTRREVVRLELSDFLDLLESHMARLAQEGRLENDE
jgi:hypothetical protein